MVQVLQKEDNNWVKKCMEYEIEFQTKRKTKEGQERLGKKLPNT